MLYAPTSLVNQNIKSEGTFHFHGQATLPYCTFQLCNFKSLFSSKSLKLSLILVTLCFAFILNQAPVNIFNCLSDNILVNYCKTRILLTFIHFQIFFINWILRPTVGNNDKLDLNKQVSSGLSEKNGSQSLAEYFQYFITIK